MVISALARGQVKSVSVAEGEKAFNPSVAVNRKTPGNFLVATGEGIYYSSDEGKTWQKSQSDVPAAIEHRVLSDRKGDLYDFFLALNPESNRFDRIVCQSSRDGGITWQALGTINVADKDLRHLNVSIQNKSGEFMLTWTQYDKYGSDNPEHKSNIMHAQSKDGKKWSSALQVNQLSGDCMDRGQTPKGAMPAINSRAMMFVAWAMNQRIYIDRSFNKGETWLTNDIFIADQPGGWFFNIPGMKRSEGLPEFLVDNSSGRYNGTLFLIWADQRNGANDTDIWFLRSVNFGDNWTSALRVNDDETGKHQYMPAMAVDQSDGSVYVIYYDRRSYDDDRTDVYLAYSTDNGTSFKNVKVSDEPFIPGADIDLGTYISIDAHQGTIVPVWTVVKEGKVHTQVTVIKKDDLIKKTP